MLKNICSLKELRQSREMSQAEVAAAMDMSLQQYGRRERSPYTLTFGQTERLAIILEVPFHEMWRLVRQNEI